MKVLSLLKSTWHEWLEDKAPRMGAALAFYTVFSLAPLLIIVIAISGFFFGRTTAQEEILTQISVLIGDEGSRAIATLISAAQLHTRGFLATTIGVLTLLTGAAGTLFELQDGLNRVWNVKSSDDFVPLIRHRLISLALLIGVAFLLLVSLVISATLAALGTLLRGRFPVTEAFWHSADFVLSSVVIMVLFAMIYKILPDTEVRWGDVWMGAAAASVLFTLGKFLVGLYIGKSAIASAYGAAGSFVVVLMWVYYSALLLYFGAEFTKVYADRFGSRNSQ